MILLYNFLSNIKSNNLVWLSRFYLLPSTDISLKCISIIQLWNIKDFVFELLSFSLFLLNHPTISDIVLKQFPYKSFLLPVKLTFTFVLSAYTFRHCFSVVSEIWENEFFTVITIQSNGRKLFTTYERFKPFHWTQILIVPSWLYTKAVSLPVKFSKNCIIWACWNRISKLTRIQQAFLISQEIRTDTV